MLLSGSTDFALSGAPDLSVSPLTVTPGSAALPMRVLYTPSDSKGAAAKVAFSYSTETGRAGTFAVNLAGTAPEFGYTYQFQPNGNTSLLAPGATVAFPQAVLNETASVLVTLTNRGTGAGAVNNVALTGPDKFVLAGVPFMPATVDASRTLQFSVRFTPTDFAAVSGDVRVDAAGSSLQFKVAGSGLGPAYSYVVVDAKGVAIPVEAGGVIRVPDAAIGGEKPTVTVRVANNGNDTGRVSTLSVSGAGFALLETPFLPYTLLPDGSFAFKIQFAPTQPGKTAGNLRIGNDDFAVEGTALGPNLTFSYSAAGSTMPVPGGGTVVLPAVAAGETSTVQFTVNNEGTAAGNIVSISASGTGTVFSISGTPSLPGKIEPGASLSFTLTFAPVTTGSSSGTLRVDAQTFSLSGSGNPPAALPEYSFTGSSGAVEPAQEPAIGLSLASPYGLQLNGTLKLTFNSEVFADDPAVQFASGGRTVNFTIPAGSKQAVFANGATQMKLKSGTTAGAISVSPSFTTSAGGIDLTPTSPQTLNMVVAQTAPRLMNVLVGSKSNNTFTLLVTGYATGVTLPRWISSSTPFRERTWAAPR